MARTAPVLERRDGRAGPLPRVDTGRGVRGDARSRKAAGVTRRDRRSDTPRTTLSIFKELGGVIAQRVVGRPRFRVDEIDRVLHRPDCSDGRSREKPRLAQSAQTRRRVRGLAARASGLDPRCDGRRRQQTRSRNLSDGYSGRADTRDSADRSRRSPGSATGIDLPRGPRARMPRLHLPHSAPLGVL